METLGYLCLRAAPAPWFVEGLALWQDLGRSGDLRVNNRGAGIYFLFFFGTLGYLCLQDGVSDCSTWHSDGHCASNSDVQQNCQLSCGLCPSILAFGGMRAVVTVSTSAGGTLKAGIFTFDRMQRCLLSCASACILFGARWHACYLER